MGHVPQFTADAAVERRTGRRAIPAARDEMGIKRARNGPPPVAASYATVGSVVLVASYGQAMPAAVADAVLESRSTGFIEEETGAEVSVEALENGDGLVMDDEETADAEVIDALAEVDQTVDSEVEALVEPDEV
jgi:hypothetical protein